MPESLPPGAKTLFKVHKLAYKYSGGLIGHYLTPSVKCLLLTTTGAKSGKERISPLVYGRDGKNIILIASQGGVSKNPPWYHNLLAHPEVHVQMGRSHSEMHARIATGRERTRLWKSMVKIYGGYEGYQRKTTRTIPVVVLEPTKP